MPTNTKIQLYILVPGLGAIPVTGFQGPNDALGRPTAFLNANLATLISGENQTTNRLNVEPIYNYVPISTITTLVCKNGAGTFHSLDYTAVATGVIKIYDGINNGGTLLRTITSPATLLQNEVNKIFDISVLVGLYIETSVAAQNILVGVR
jgi:hypothetical protein